MTRKAVVACLLFASGMAACSKEPEPLPSVESLPPGASVPDRPRDLPYRDTGSRYSTDHTGSAPRTGINSDPDNPSGAPQSKSGSFGR